MLVANGRECLIKQCIGLFFARALSARDDLLGLSQDSQPEVFPLFARRRAVWPHATGGAIRVVLKTVSLFLLGIEILEPTMEVFKPAAVVPDEPLEGRLGLGGAALLVR